MTHHFIRKACHPPDGQEKNMVRICKYMLYVRVTVEWKIPDRGVGILWACVSVLFRYSQHCMETWGVCVFYSFIWQVFGFSAVTISFSFYEQHTVHQETWHYYSNFEWVCSQNNNILVKGNKTRHTSCQLRFEWRMKLLTTSFGVDVSTVWADFLMRSLTQEEQWNTR